LKKTENIIWSPWATVGLGAVIFIVWCLVQAVVMLCITAVCFNGNNFQDFASFSTQMSMNGSVWGASTLLGSLAGVGLIWTGIQLKKGAVPKNYLALNPISLKTIAAVAGFSVLVGLLFDLLTYFLGQPIVPDLMIKGYTSDSNHVLFWMGAVLFTPFYEEFFYRGFLFEGLRHSRLGVVGAALLTSALWVFLYLPYGYIVVGFIFLSGLIRVWVRLKTGSLWSCVVFHATVNLVGMVELVLAIHGYLPK
jgi:membrane protease YdiL (CAAX protease family)